MKYVVHAFGSELEKCPIRFRFESNAVIPFDLFIDMIRKTGLDAEPYNEYQPGDIHVAVVEDKATMFTDASAEDWEHYFVVENPD